MKRYNLLILLIVLLVVSCQTKSPNHCDEMLSTYKTGEVLRMKHHINEDTFEIRTYYKNGILAQRGNVIITKDDYYRKYGYWYYYYSNGNEAYKRYFSSGMDLQYYSFDDPATANIACHINIPLSTTCESYVLDVNIKDFAPSYYRVLVLENIKDSVEEWRYLNYSQSCAALCDDLFEMPYYYELNIDSSMIRVDDTGRSYLVLGIKYMKRDNFDNSDVERIFSVYYD